MLHGLLVTHYGINGAESITDLARPIGVTAEQEQEAAAALGREWFGG